MVDLGQLKIKKKTYNFEVKRRFQNVRSYKVIQKPPLEVMKDKFKEFLSRKKKPRKSYRPKAEAKPVAPPPTVAGFNIIVVVAFVFIALIVLGIGLLFLTAAGAGVTPEFQPQVEKPDMENIILEAEIFTSGERGTVNHQASLLLDYQTKNVNNYSVTITAYSEEIPSEVYVLRSEYREASQYSEFLRLLRSNLSQRKMVLNEITISELETMPDGAIVVVPSGFVPKEILGFDSTMNMDDIANRGIIIVYIGQSFSRMFNGSDVVNTPKDPLKELPVVFNENAPIASTGGFNLFQPLYQVVPRSQWRGSMAYGSVSILKKGTGAFVFLPQTLDGGWRGAEGPAEAASDVARIIFETPWAQPIGQPKSYAFTEDKDLTSTRYLFSNPFEGNRSALKVEYTASSEALDIPLRETQYISVSKKQLGDLYVEGGVKQVSTNITDEPVRLNAIFREPEPGRPNMYLSIADIYGNEIESLPQGNLDAQGRPNFDLNVYLDRGEYMVRALDNEGKLYAQSYLKVVSIDIVYRPGVGRSPSVYTFDILMDGQPLSLGEVQVSVNKGTHGTYQFADVSRISVDVGPYTGGSPLDYGSHEFAFTAGNFKTSLTVDRIRPYSIFTDLKFYFVIFFTVGIVGVGVIFAKQDIVYYSIDIPDFPPVARAKIPMASATILSIFPKVNENYRWKNSPLTISEIKNGFKDLFAGGRPLFITDYNVEFLLHEFERRGLVKESMGYYGLKEWENSSKHSIEYLAMLRRLRDICVNNATPFTGLGESSVADSEVTVVGQQMFLHFYDRASDPSPFFSRVLSSVGQGITMIIFRNASDRYAFQEVLSSPSAAAVTAKMELEGGSLQLLTFEEFEQTVRELKGM